MNVVETEQPVADSEHRITVLVPKEAIPRCLKSIARLIGVTADTFCSWLELRKLNLDLRKEALIRDNSDLAMSLAAHMPHDTRAVQRTLEGIARQACRKQVNKESVCVAMIDELRNTTSPEDVPSIDQPPLLHDIDDDWLNVFERYAEDASTERMQKLWGRVLAGEIRQPGKVSVRALRSLAEFSQAEANAFALFCESVFGGIAPLTLVKPAGMKSIANLVFMEAIGLITGAENGLLYIINFNEKGNGSLSEGSTLLVLSATSQAKITTSCIALTPLGRELVSVLPGRNARVAAKRVGLSIRQPEISSAYVALSTGEGTIIPIETLWGGHDPGAVKSS